MTINKQEQFEIYRYLLELAARTADHADQCSDRYLRVAHQQRAEQIKAYANEFYKR